MMTKKVVKLNEEEECWIEMFVESLVGRLTLMEEEGKEERKGSLDLPPVSLGPAPCFPWTCPLFPLGMAGCLLFLRSSGTDSERKPIKPNPSQGGDGKPRVPRGQPGRRSRRNFAGPWSEHRYGPFC